MTPTQAYFRACKLYFRSYLVWLGAPTIREFHLKIAKRDLELARALLTYERNREKNTHGRN